MYIAHHDEYLVRLHVLGPCVISIVMSHQAAYVWRAGRSTPAKPLFQLYLFIHLSYIVYLFTFPLRPAALSPSGN